MMIEVSEQINVVERRVGERVIEAGQARSVIISRTYPAGIEDVWDACTDPERIARWFAPVSGDLRVGGRYQVEGNAGGTIERCDPPKSFAATWEFGGEVSGIELRLTAEPDGGTRFELEHVGHVDDERWGEFGPGAVGVGWDLAVVGLAGHLTEGGLASVAEGTAWMGSEEGRDFMTQSARRWQEAHIAAGADPTEAAAAADRTIAAYTAPQPG